MILNQAYFRANPYKMRIETYLLFLLTNSEINFRANPYKMRIETISSSRPYRQQHNFRANPYKMRIETPLGCYLRSYLKNISEQILIK